MATIAVLVAAGAISSGAPAAADQVLEYVNLGDSFSAGAGISPTVQGQERCSQSERNFSHIVAAEFGYRLTDVSCSGAKTDDFFAAQYEDVQPQLDALTSTTELVTLMIGGNNNNTFATAISSCIGAKVSNPIAFDPCRAQYGETLIDPVRTKTYPAVVAALSAVHAQSPQAHVVIAGYPWLLPAGGSCGLQVPIADGDISYLRDLQATLNGVVKRAAEETGSTFVDMSTVSEGRDACQGVDERLVEPVLFVDGSIPLHPNAEGERVLASQVAAAIGRGGEMQFYDTASDCCGSGSSW